MASTDTVELDEDERASFLGVGGTGVLSFGTGVGQAPYSLPVSYGYDDESGAFYFRLGIAADGEKAGYVEDRRPVSLVVHRETDAGWHSVVARGQLEEVTESAIGSDAMQGLSRVEIPLVDIFDRPTEEITFRFYRLEPTSVSGRREVPR